MKKKSTPGIDYFKVFEADKWDKIDAETGLPRALVSAGYLNGFRTAAANAVAGDRLARANASTLGVLGAGHQAAFEVRAVAHRRPLSAVKVWSRSLDSAKALCRDLADLGCSLTAVAASEIAPMMRAAMGLRSWSCGGLSE